MVNGYTHGIHAAPAQLGDEAAEDRDAKPAAAAVAAAPPNFDEVYVCHFDFVCRSLRLLGVTPSGIEDAAQDVFGVVARRLGDFLHDASIKTWLFAITQRVAANHRRSERRKRPVASLVESAAANDATPEAHAEAARAAALIEAFAESLDDGHRAVLVLGLIERVAASELARELGIPRNTVYSRMRSVREGLRSFLAKNGIVT